MLGNIILFICFIWLVVYMLLKYTVFDYWRKRNVPFIKPNYIFGNMWDVICLRKPFCIFIYDLHMSYPNERYIGFYNLFKPAILIRDLEITKDILVKDFNSFQNNWFEAHSSADPVLSRNPFIRRDKEWKDTRNLITPQFTASKIKSMVPVIQAVCETMIQYITKESTAKGSTCFEITDLSARVTGEAVMNCAYGVQIHSFSKKVPETLMIIKSTSYLPSTLLSLKETLGLLSQFFAKLLKVTYNGERLHPMFSNIIRNAIDNKAMSNVLRNDYLDYLIELRNNGKIADSDINGFAHVFFHEGFEAVAAALSYALIELSENQDLQERARNNVEEVLQNHNGKMPFEALKELDYLERVIFEALRKHTPTPIYGKICTENYVLHDSARNTDITIEKGTAVFWSARALHENPEYYPEPYTFDPDRFTEEAKKTRPKSSYQIFGEGGRICIGRRYAMTTVMLALASLLSEFDVRINKKTILPIKRDGTHHIDHKPKGGLYADFIPRTRNAEH